MADFAEEAPLVGVSDGVYEAFVVDDVNGDYSIALGSFNVSSEKVRFWENLRGLT